MRIWYQKNQLEADNPFPTVLNSEFVNMTVNLTNVPFEILFKLRDVQAELQLTMHGYDSDWNKNG